MRTVLLVAALAAVSGSVAAEGPIGDRVRLLEQQLHEAQARIEELQSNARRHTTSDHTPRSKNRRARIAAGQVEVERETPPAGPVDPVLLLLETLRKRGTITASDYEELKAAVVAKQERLERAPSTPEPPSGTVAAAPPAVRLDEGIEKPHKQKELPVSAHYQFGKGLTVQTLNRKFDLTLRNRIQTRYTFTDQDDPAKDDTSSFRVRRLKTRLYGHILYPSLRYDFEVEFARRPRVDHAFVRWSPRRYFGIQTGQYLVPFNRQQITSSAYQQFVDRASTNDFFSFGHDQGVTFRGRAFGPRADRLVWDLGIFNGNGGNQLANENVGHLGVGRVLYMPLGGFKYYVESDVENTRTPRLGIGAAYAYNSQADSTPRVKPRILRDTGFGRFFGINFADRFDVSQATADVQFKYRGFSMLGDYYWAEAAPNTALAKTAQGFNLQAGYFLIPRRLEAALRYAFIDRDIDAPKTGLREVGGALGYFFLAHNLKLQMDVRDIEDEAPLGRTRNTMEYRTQLQAIF